MTERPVRDGLERVLRSLGGPSVDGLRVIIDRWPEIAGERAAGRTRPIVVEADRLVVAADDPATADDLRWREADVVGRIAELTGERLDRMEVRVRPREGDEA